jgi:REP element-mobilizing transposase RayT
MVGMARPLRIDIEDGWHHVMNRGTDRSAVFLDDSDRIEFGTRLADVHARFGVETHAYCLMTTHFHALLHCPNGGLSDAMQRLGSIYTRHVNDRAGRDGALFRGRFHSRLVVSDAHLLAAVRYIHRNALDLPEVDHVERYRWSSHRAYLGYRTVPPWLRTDVVLGHFGNDTTAFAAFVEASDPPETIRRPTSEELAGFERAAAFVLAELGLGERGKIAALARAATIAFVLEVSNTSGAWTEAWMQEAFRFPSRNALRSAVSRVRSRLASDPVFGAAVERTADLVSSTRLHQGSDPCCNHRAARAAS